MRRDPAGITPEQRQRIIDEISSGQLDIASAATKYNIPQMVINRWLNVVPSRSTGTTSAVPDSENSPADFPIPTPPAIPEPPQTINGNHNEKPAQSVFKPQRPRGKSGISAGVIMTLAVTAAVLLLIGIAVITSDNDSSELAQSDETSVEVTNSNSTGNDVTTNPTEDQASNTVTQDNSDATDSETSDEPTDESSQDSVNDSVEDAADTATPDDTASSNNQDLLEQLYNTRVDWTFDAMPLQEVLASISKSLQITIELDRGALLNTGVSADEPISFNKSALPLNSALTQMLTAVGLTYKIDGDSLLVTTRRNTAATKPLSTEKLFEVSQPAVATLVLLDANNEILKQGTGFFISNKGLLITTAHLINHPDAIRLLVKSGSNFYGANSIDQYDHDADIAAVTINGMGNSFPTLQLSNSGPATNMEVSIVGLTDTTSLESTIRDGEIADVGSVSPIQFSLSFATLATQSGSPILEKTGRVVGIYNHRLGLENSNPTGINADQIVKVLGSAAEAVLIQDVSATFGNYASPNP
ncbi:MAG: trypsin-like peptidase domain-containing protein [Pirellulaceae bacterium]